MHRPLTDPTGSAWAMGHRTAVQIPERSPALWGRPSSTSWGTAPPLPAPPLPAPPGRSAVSVCRDWSVAGGVLPARPAQQ
ncbi:hypothetical protein PGN35_007870 [Nodosilinea sp. PGN35]|uniref:hypothetical protein n=1 Tax=Nodosilinea sp. PGN35 TaxID=3020489 RepID=UPI00398B144B